MTVLATLPRLALQLDGQPLPSEDAAALGEVRIQQRLSLPTLCELVFLDPRGALAVGARMVPGAALKVTMEHDEPLFAGQVTAVEYQYGPSGAREARVRAYDPLHRLRKRQPVQTHVQTTLAEVARDMVADLGLQVVGEPAGPVWERVVQFRQSDLELLAELAERCGLYFTLRGDALHFLTLAGVGEPFPLSLGKSLHEARIDVNGDPACRSVEALGWNPLDAGDHRGSASEPRVGRQIEAEVSPASLGGTGKRLLADETVQTDAQATALAQAELDRRVAAEVVLWGIADGNPRLQPGTPVELEGVAAPLAGRYVLTSVTHTVDRERGFLSEIETLPPPARVRPRGTISTVGVVSRVDDPEGLGRVRVSLPSLGDLETDWIEVVTAGAGKAKGVIVQPDVDDRVLLLLAREDFAQAVVVGGLYGREAPPDPGVQDGAVRRYTFLTPGGQRVRLDDARKTVRVENSSGNSLQLSPGRARLSISDGTYIELSRKGMVIHCETDLTIEAPGRAVTVRGDSIDFERA